MSINLLYSANIPTSIQVTFGLTVKDNLLVFPAYTDPSKRTELVDYQNNFAIDSTFTNGYLYRSMHYDSTNNQYWAAAFFIPTATPNVYDSKIYKLNASGGILQSINFKTLIPVADRLNESIAWTNLAASGVTLSPDRTQVLMNVYDRSRMYKFSTAGAYQGYKDLFTNDAAERVSALTTDTQNIWYATYTATGVASLYKADANGNYIESYPLSNQDIGLEGLGIVTDIEFDNHNFGDACALWIKSYGATAGGQYVFAMEVPCIVPPCEDNPTINAENKTIYVNSTFNPLTNVTATGCYNSDLTAAIEVVSNNVNTAIVGIYTVEYRVVDPTNNKATTKIITVECIEKPPVPPMEQAKNDIIESIALEQTALSHILNAEGEKIQKALSFDINTDQLLKINASVVCMTNTITRLETILQGKLELIDCNICNK